MTDVYQADRDRILGITRNAEIAQRVQTDLAIRAAQQIEAEQAAAAQARQEALAKEAQMIAQADSAAVEKYSSLQALYAEREEAARLAIEAVARLARIEADLRAGLSEPDRIASSVEYRIEETQRDARRSALRVRGGIPARHIFIAPKQWLTDDSQRIGAVAVAAVTYTPPIILPDRIQLACGFVNFDFV